MDLNSYLISKTAEYAPFNPRRFPRIYQTYTEHFSHKNPKVIHIVGTNGKGSTGRFLALMLRSNGANVGHFTSPHISEFRERFWINGALVDNDALENAHRVLFETGLFHEASYFEYATLLAAYLFRNLDFCILEAGLGGEFDSTTTLHRDLSLFTTIGLDHQEFLGESIQEIATTKLNSMAKVAILGKQYDKRIIEIARDIAHRRGSILKLLEDSHDSCSKHEEEYFTRYQLPDYQRYNFRLAYLAMEHFGAQWHEIGALDLCGRFERHGALILDVGHNPLAAHALLSALNGASIELIYNSYKDKDISGILEILRPCIKKIHIMPIAHNDRIIDSRELVEMIQKARIPVDEFRGELKAGVRYVVFGSFSVVAHFKEHYNTLLR